MEGLELFVLQIVMLIAKMQSIIFHMAIVLAHRNTARSSSFCSGFLEWTSSSSSSNEQHAQQ